MAARGPVGIRLSPLGSPGRPESPDLLPAPGQAQRTSGPGQLDEARAKLAGLRRVKLAPARSKLGASSKLRVGLGPSSGQARANLGGLRAKLAPARAKLGPKHGARLSCRTRRLLRLRRNRDYIPATGSLYCFDKLPPPEVLRVESWEAPPFDCGNTTPSYVISRATLHSAVTARNCDSLSLALRSLSEEIIFSWTPQLSDAGSVKRRQTRPALEPVDAELLEQRHCIEEF